MKPRRRSLEHLAREMRRLDEAMSVGPGRPWRPSVWPTARQRLYRRYDELMLEAAAMLGVAVPAPTEWLRLGFRGGLFDDGTGFAIEEALRGAGFDPLGVGQPDA